MIQFFYKQCKILFIGINPHFGSFNRGVPFSNNKLFWYLLSDARILKEKRGYLRDDKSLKLMYMKRFNSVYRLGLINIIKRPTRSIVDLRKGEELPGRKRITQIINTEKPDVVCFIGKATYEKYTGVKGAVFGWQDNIDRTKIFVMHSPLRGKASVRIRELRKVALAARLRKR